MADFYKLYEFSALIDANYSFDASRVDEEMLKKMFITTGQRFNCTEKMKHRLTRLGDIIQATGKDVSLFVDEKTLSPIAILLVDNYDYLADWMLTDAVLNMQAENGKTLAHIASGCIEEPWRFYTKEATFMQDYEGNTPAHVYQDCLGLYSYIFGISPEDFDAKSLSIKNDDDGSVIDLEAHGYHAFLEDVDPIRLAKHISVSNLEYLSEHLDSFDNLQKSLELRIQYDKHCAKLKNVLSGLDVEPTV
jgi:hypothetical protein